MTSSVSRLRGMFLASAATLALSTFAAMAEEAVVVVQLNEYVGDEAYFALYLVNPEGKYEKTLWLSGPEKVWWPQTARWFGYFSRNAEDVDAITGASTPSGSRAVMRLDIDPKLIDAGYTLRVETSVDQQENYQQDAEVALTHANERVKTPGTGYVRYIRYKL
jgi:hypothetical protein